MNGPYDERYHRARHGRLLADSDFFDLSAQIAREKYGPHLHGACLDIGCGVGRNSAWRSGTVGVDVSEYAVVQARRAGLEPVAVMKAESLGIQSNSFDTVLIAHVLEHMPEPLVVLRESGRVLVDDGRLVVSVPLQGYRSEAMDCHLYVWGQRELRNLLALAGFRVERAFHAAYRMKRVLAMLPIPARRKLRLSRWVGRLALGLGLQSGSMELIVLARKDSCA